MMLVIVALLIPLWFLLSRDFVRGLCYAMVILVSCTHLLRIPTPGSLPELSIHRLVILSLLVFWFQRRDQEMRWVDVPLARRIGLWALVVFVSFLGGIDHATGIKRYLDYILEFFLFYFILATSLRSRDDGMKILGAVGIGLTIVALLAIAERYTDVNVVDRFIGTSDEESGAYGNLRATYRHRILLGTGMAMGWPLLFYFSQNATSRLRRQLSWVAVMAMFAACYYAMSRGPWLAAVIAAAVMVRFGSAAVRRRMTVIAGLVVLLLVSRPGVFTTLKGYAVSTVNVDSFKGGTFMYRLELWQIAFNEVSSSPWRFLFGHGPGSGANQTIEWTLSYRDKEQEVWSWDNDLAYTLFQYGFLGLFATFALYAAIPLRLLARARQESGPERDFYVCLAASTLVLFFMMSNVMIFARQLYYLLWTFTAVGLVLMESRLQSVPETTGDEMPEEPLSVRPQPVHNVT